MKKVISVIVMLSTLLVGCSGAIKENSEDKNLPKEMAEEPLEIPSSIPSKTPENFYGHKLGRDDCTIHVFDIGKVVKVEAKDSGSYDVYYEVVKQNIIYDNNEDGHIHDTPKTKESDIVCVKVSNEGYNKHTKYSENEYADKEKNYVPQVGEGILVNHFTYYEVPTSVEKIDDIVYLGMKEGRGNGVRVTPYDYSGLVSGEVISIMEDNIIKIKVDKDRGVFKTGDELTIQCKYARTKSYKEVFEESLETYVENKANMEDLLDYILDDLNSEEKIELKEGDTISFKYGEVDAISYSESVEGTDVIFTPMVVTVISE